MAGSEARPWLPHQDFKMPPVGAAGVAAVLGLGGYDEAAGLLGQTVEAGECPALELGDNQICHCKQSLAGLKA